MKHRIAAIPDDGIGKEVVPEGRRVLDAAVQFATAPTRPRSGVCEHHAQDGVDAEPRVQEALVGVALFVHFAAPRFTAMRSWALQVRKSVVSGRPILRT